MPSPRVIVLSAVAALALSVGVGGVALASGHDDSPSSCSQFPKQKDAQDAFDRNPVKLAALDDNKGGPKNGIACDKPQGHDPKGGKDDRDGKDGRDGKGREHDRDSDKDADKAWDKGHKGFDDCDDTCDAGHKKKSWDDCDNTCDDPSWKHAKDWDDCDDSCDDPSWKQDKDTEDCDCDDDKKKDDSDDDKKKDDDSSDDGGQVKVHPKGGVDTGGWGLETVLA